MIFDFIFDLIFAEPPSPQAALQSLGVTIGYGAILVCAFVFVVGVGLETKDPDDPARPSS